MAKDEIRGYLGRKGLDCVQKGMHVGLMVFDPVLG